MTFTDKNDTIYFAVYSVIAAKLPNLTTGARLDIISDYKYKLNKELSVANTDVEFPMPDCTKWVQIAVATSAAYTAGTLTVYYKPYGFETYLPYYSAGSLVTIDLSAPRALVLQDFAISGIKLVVSGTGSDVGKTFDVSVASLSDNAVIYKD